MRRDDEDDTRRDDGGDLRRGEDKDDAVCSLLGLVEGARRGETSRMADLCERDIKRIHEVVRRRLWQILPHGPGPRPAVGSAWRRKCRDPNEHANDVAQEAWVSIVENIKQLADVRNYLAWSAVLALNKANKHRRKCYRETILLKPLDPDDRASRIVPFHLGRQQLQLLKDALEEARRINKQFGEIFELRSRGLRDKEIAGRLGISHGAVRVAFWRWMPELRRRLGLDGKNKRS